MSVGQEGWKVDKHLSWLVCLLTELLLASLAILFMWGRKHFLVSFTILSQIDSLGVSGREQSFPADVEVGFRILEHAMCGRVFYKLLWHYLSGAAKWAQDTLEAHRNDKRAYVYNRQQLEQAKTHDNLWNAAQVRA